MKAGGQREKGKDAERKLVRLLKARFPGIDVRRSSQAERAHQADVWTTGHAVLDRCWLEVTDARRPDPQRKLKQAERDAARVWDLIGGRPNVVERLPVVVHHKLGERTTYASMRLGTLAWAMNDGRVDDAAAACEDFPELVTLDLIDFLELLR